MTEQTEPAKVPKSVTTRREAGAKGYRATLAKYGSKQLDAWRRTGGRKKNPTLAEILAATGQPKSTRVTTRGGEPNND